MSAPFSRGHLQQLGFEGFRNLRSARLGTGGIPRASGVYAVLTAEPVSAAFLESSVGGWFKGRNPTVSAQRLTREWVDGAETLYLGRADNLRRRIDQLARFGRGEPIGHWGGRLLWQLVEHDQLLVAWLQHRDPVAREAELISDFVAAYGTLPYANLSRPRIRNRS